MRRGYFISIEGNDGSGKSTQIKLMKEYFADKGFEVVESREPGGTRIGEKIRDIVLDNKNIEMNPVTEALLYAASRAQHVQEVIKPCIEQGKVVICDRYIDSSLAYQGAGRGLGIDTVSAINNAAIQGIMPDLTIFFDINPEVALNRRFKDGEADRIELEKLEFHKKVYKGYKQIASKNSRIKVIDASRSVMEIHKDVIEIIDKFLLEKSAI